jgi:hypothetical protein
VGQNVPEHAAIGSRGRLAGAVRIGTKRLSFIVGSKGKNRNRYHKKDRKEYAFAVNYLFHGLGLLVGRK